MKLILMSAMAFTLVAVPALAAQTIETFDSVSGWRAAPASGVEMRIDRDAGRSGTALRVDFDFHGGGGWAAFRRETKVALPANYEISFWIRGDAPKNTLEFKLVDASGENVWWVNRPEFEFAGDWRKVTFRKRHVTFAWGPKGGGDIHDVAAIEFAVTAGTGGRGSIWIDDLVVTPRETVLPYDVTPVIWTTTAAWTMDFTRNREYGGVIITWPGAGPRSYDVQTSMDGTSWLTVRTVDRGTRSRDYLQLPESESRYLRLRLDGGSPSDVRDVRVMPVEWGESRNRLYETIAADAPAGSYPKYFSARQSYWTVIGENGSPREAMINEEGAIEVDKRRFTIEPFLETGGRLITWADARISQSLASGYLPIPSVSWSVDGLSMTTTAWVDSATLWLRYRVANTGRSARTASLALAIRPFQVNPLSQFLNNAGGVAPISRITRGGDGSIMVDSQRVAVVTKPTTWNSWTFDEGDVVDHLRRADAAGHRDVADPASQASASLSYRLDLAAGQSRDIFLAVPFTSASAASSVVPSPAAGAVSLAAATRKWLHELDRFDVLLPASMAQVSRSLRSNVAYILINRDSAAIQPGSRSYERSWIRDGSLTSAALLRVGHEREVRAFIEWYAPFQYADGKVPCCVDRRGADPVPENDSHGELIYLITEYFRFTRDTALAQRMWPHVERAVAYMDSLRASRRTPEYVNTEFFGLLPQSISHEGYSAKPMHSYWDDSFALKGYKDAAWLALELHRDAAPIVRSRDAFQHDLMRSLTSAMQKRGIDYLPGAAELGDFDATSTTVAVNPAGAQHDLPRAALARTFDRYWEEFVARRRANAWEAYTPYEWRVVGTMVRLGQKQRAHEVLAWFMEHQRPAAWNHWSEAVYRERDTPHFIGDMPHTWVGSDFIRSMLDMFVYEDNDALVLGAGILPGWLSATRPVGIHGIRTPFGTAGYEMTRRGSSVVIRFDPARITPPGGFIVRSPNDSPIRSAAADGRTIAATADAVVLRVLPRELVLRY